MIKDPLPALKLTRFLCLILMFTPSYEVILATTPDVVSNTNREQSKRMVISKGV